VLSAASPRQPITAGISSGPQVPTREKSCDGWMVERVALTLTLDHGRFAEVLTATG
jgi:hypothetical protein